MVKALIVDGDYKSTKAVELLVGDYGFETCTAETGQKGLVKLLGEDPDIILCEDVLIDMATSEFTNEIRTNEKYSESSKTPIIVYGHRRKNGMRITRELLKYYPRLPLDRPKKD